MSKSSSFNYKLNKKPFSDYEVFVFQGTLPPPYSSAVPSEANGSLSSPVSTMTSQSSASSLAKQRQSWLDLVSQASPPVGETTVVCAAQVHSHQPPQEETEEEEEENSQVLESSAPQDSSETGPNEESPEAEGEAQREVSGAEGETPVFEQTFILSKGDCILDFCCVIFSCKQTCW